MLYSWYVRQEKERIVFAEWSVIKYEKKERRQHTGGQRTGLVSHIGRFLYDYHAASECLLCRRRSVCKQSGWRYRPGSWECRVAHHRCHHCRRNRNRRRRGLLYEHQAGRTEVGRVQPCQSQYDPCTFCGRRCDYRMLPSIFNAAAKTDGRLRQSAHRCGTVRQNHDCRRRHPGFILRTCTYIKE